MNILDGYIDGEIEMPVDMVRLIGSTTDNKAAQSTEQGKQDEEDQNRPFKDLSTGDQES